MVNFIKRNIRYIATLGTVITICLTIFGYLLNINTQLTENTTTLKHNCTSITKILEQQDRMSSNVEQLRIDIHLLKYMHKETRLSNKKIKTPLIAKKDSSGNNTHNVFTDK